MRLLIVIVMLLVACTTPPTNTPTATDTLTPSETNTPTETETSTWTDTIVPTESSEAPQAPTVSPTETAPVISSTPLPLETPPPTLTLSLTPPDATLTNTSTITPQPSRTPSPTKTPTRIPTPTRTSIPAPQPQGTTVTNEKEFRACIAKANATCIVVGTIVLTARTQITADNVTVIGFGQAYLTNSPANVYSVIEVVEADGVTLRNLHVRRSPNTAKGNGDGISITGSRNVLIENVSVAWSIDGGIDINSSQFVTVRNSIIAEGLRLSTHTDGAHSMCMLIFTSSNVLIQGNLFLSCKERNPRVVSSQNVTIRDNWIYNFGSHPTVVSSEYAASSVNYMNNKLIPGPDSPDITHGVAITNVVNPVSVYADKKVVRDNDWRYVVNAPLGSVGQSRPFDIATVGASPRDSVDLRLVGCTVSRKCVIVDRAP